MLITCSAAFFLQDITNLTCALALPVLALPVLVPQVLQVLQVLPLLSWQAQAVSSLVLMGNLLM